MFSRLPGRVRTVLFHGKSSPLEGSLDGTEPWEPGPIVDQTPEVPLVLIKVWANPFGGLKHQDNGSSQVPGLVQASKKKKSSCLRTWKRLASHIKFVHFPCFLGFPCTPYRTCRLQNDSCCLGKPQLVDVGFLYHWRLKALKAHDSSIVLEKGWKQVLPPLWWDFPINFKINLWSIRVSKMTWWLLHSMFCYSSERYVRIRNAIHQVMN